MTGAPFLTTKVVDHWVAVEVAWGADLTDVTGASWTWDDITDDVVLGGGDETGEAGISIVIGRPDFSSETQTANLSLQLDNRSGAYSEGGLSTHWPNVRRGTPVRVRVSNNGGTDWYTRFQGSAIGFTPQWDPETGRWATVELSASGPLRRFNQGTLAGYSAMRTGTLADSTVVAYWPFEEEQQADFVLPAIGSARGVFRTYDYDVDASVPGVPGTFASYANISSSAPLMTLSPDGSVIFTLDSATSESSSTVSVLFGNPAGVPPGNNDPGITGTGCLFSVYTPNASIRRWDVCYFGENILEVHGSPAADSSFSEYTFRHAISYANLRPNTDYEIGLSLSQSGSTTTWELWVNGVTPDIEGRAFSTTRSSNTNGAQVNQLNIGTFSDVEGLAVGHAAIRVPKMALWADEEWLQGYSGEGVTARLERLCAEHGTPLTLVIASDVPNSSITDWMGPQYHDSLTNLLRECERTGQGVLYDGLDAGLTFVTKRRRETNANGPAALTIDAAANQLMGPFAPIDDDQLTINHCDVARRNGTTTTHSDITGPMGIDAIGDYATSYTVNCETDDGLVHYAEWTVGVGIQQGYRYPTISFALETNEALIPGWLACLPQSRIDVTNVASIRRQHPDEAIKLLLEGWQEEITAFTWRVTANTSSAAPWNVVVLADALGSTGDGICHMDTDDSQLNASVAEGVTSISVRTNSGPLWVTTAGDADSFPFDVDIGGIQATVTAITGATSPQTFTLAEPLPREFTGSTTPGAGTPIKVWRPPVLGL